MLFCVLRVQSPLRLNNAHTVTKTSFYLREPVVICPN
jgi:hypothetical protein